MLDVLFPCVDDFDWAIDMLGDTHRLDRHIGLEPAAETATEQMLVDRHLFRRQAKRRGNGGLHPRHDLGADPEFAAAG